ncbi:bactofilin family protein [Fulvivirga sedimenti]|uniref:Polymer-forming cytoskeletal protein n=1 Tax=Fulvivirga sedimenti TaxID=2879465 RepID=A0A9X1HXL2_9BACT|nr:polymer-forming cytoskeletal protein [Fulvivirga sedimenti]MCA6078314.1 polymer-forming cytoskeletal protein [Fulvivirga sedimenti]
MFNAKDDQRNIELQSNTSNIITKGTLLEGNLDTNGNIRIEGEVKGNVKTEAKIVLGGSSKIEGDVTAQNAEVEGELKGNIRVYDTLILKPSSLIHGDITTNKLIVESGAAFNGACRMGVTANSTIPNDNGKPQQTGQSNPTRQPVS